MATGASQSYESFGDYERLAEFFRDYETGWKVISSIVAPIHSAMLGFVASYVLAIALLVLAFHMVRYDLEKLWRYFLVLIVFSVLIAPKAGPTVPRWTTDSPGTLSNMNMAATGQSSGPTSSTKVSAALWMFDELTSMGLRLLMNAVDAGISSQGKPGDFGAPAGALVAMNKAYTDLLRDANMRTAYDDYLSQCSHLAAQMSGDDATSLGLLGGTLGNSVFTRKTISAPAIAKLDQYYIKSGAYNRDDGYIIESAEYWDARLSRTSADRNKAIPRTFVSNEKYPNLQYQPKTDIPVPLQDTYSTRFFAKTCGDLWRIADLGMTQYNSGLSSNYSVKSGSAGRGAGAAGSVSNGKAMVASMLGQYYMYQLLHTDAADRTGEASNVYRGIVGGGQAAAGGALDFFYRWWSELKVQYFVVLIPGIAAATMGIIFVMFPFAAMLAILPNRAGLLANLFYSIVFVKLSVFFSYFLIKFGGLISSAAIDVMVNSNSFGGTNLASTLIPWVIGGQALTMMASIVGAPTLAYMLVFNDSTGLRSMRFDKYGAQQLAQTALTMIGTARGIGALRGGAGAAGGARPTPPSTGGGGGTNLTASHSSHASNLAARAASSRTIDSVAKRVDDEGSE